MDAPAPTWDVEMFRGQREGRGGRPRGKGRTPATGRLSASKQEEENKREKPKEIKKQNERVKEGKEERIMPEYIFTDGKMDEQKREVRVGRIGPCVLVPQEKRVG